MRARPAVAVVVADRPGDDPGAFAPVLGVPVLLRAVRGLLASGVVGKVVVVCPRRCGAAARLLDGLPVSVHADPTPAVDAVERVRSSASAVVLHDAARALAPPALAEAVVGAVRALRGEDDDPGVAVPVLALADTVKQVGPGDLITAGPDRSTLRVVQTPQAYRPDLLPGDLLRGVLADGPVERAWATVGAPVVAVPGHPLAFAIRSSWDRELAEMLAADDARGHP